MLVRSPWSRPHPPHRLVNGLRPLSAWGLAASVLTLLAPVARALEVQVNPTSPQLGDTITVWIQTEQPGSTPTVTLNGDAYPAFALQPTRYRALLPTTPLDAPGRLVLRVTGDGETRNLALNLRGRSFPTQRLWLRGGGANATDTELAQVAAFKEIVTPEKLWQGAFLRPSPGRVSTIFGVRRYYNGVFAQNYYHRGVDYAAGRGAPVVAPADGIVRLIGRESQGFRVHGNTVGLDHGQGVLSIFLHLDRIDVRAGDRLRAGQRLGTIGSTGASTGPHLHWGLYVHGEAIDPVPWRYTGLE
ncbi:MAG: M23 family metallopeptidase [Spirulinaceae cyanobacterium SM2_1_0]|nr:M23 family metallopeptidase [Spirulinaceae cyanobacterium SM2_1_0]